jgi:hypothetical protein
MPGLVSSPKRTRGPVDLVTTGTGAGVVISSFSPSVAGGLGGSLELSSPVDDCFLLRRHQNQQTTTATKSRKSPPITPPRMTMILGPLVVTVELVLVLSGSYLNRMVSSYPLGYGRASNIRGPALNCNDLCIIDV